MEEVGSLKCGCDVVMADGQTKVSGTSYSTYNIFYFLFNLKQFKLKPHSSFVWRSGSP